MRDRVGSAAAPADRCRNLRRGSSVAFTLTESRCGKVLEFAQANINAAVEHVTKLSSAKSPMEFFALSNEYAKRQFEIFTRQAQELAAIVQKMTITKDR
jgi:hypothetical protein